VPGDAPAPTPFASARAGELWRDLAARHGIDLDGRDLTVLRALIVQRALGPVPEHRSADPGGC
jgi:hypothetical protein